MRRRRATHPAEVLAQHAKCRASKAGAAVGNLNSIVTVYRLAKSSASVPCAICKRQTSPGKRHVDHTVPFALGGAHDAANLQVTCPSCNLRKGPRMAAQ